MKLQLALDLVNIPEAKEVVNEVQEYVDIVEFGTPVVTNEGLRSVKASSTYTGSGDFMSFSVAPFSQLKSSSIFSYPKINYISKGKFPF